MTPEFCQKEMAVLVQSEVVCEDVYHIPTDRLSCTPIDCTEIDIVDLYAVGHEPKVVDKKQNSIPFIHQLELQGSQGEITRIRGLFDDGAMVSVMCSTIFAKVKIGSEPGDLLNTVCEWPMGQWYLRRLAGRELLFWTV
jgi:hypothetical protein